MRTINHWLLIGIVAFVYSSCNKSDNDKNVLQGSAHDVQVFKVNAKSGASFNLERGGPANFPPHVFVNALNQPVSGVIDIHLLEIYSDPAACLGDTAKVNNRMVAGSEFYMKAMATQNGLPLHIIQGATYCAAMPFDTIFGE